MLWAAKRICLVMTIGLATGVLLAQPRTYREIADSDVDRVKDEIIQFLWNKQQPDGSWEVPREWPPTPLPACGRTALVTFALLEAGVNPNDERLKKAYEYLANLSRDEMKRGGWTGKSVEMYARAFRMMAFAILQQEWEDKNPYKEILEKDVEWLTKKSVGAWGFAGPDRQGDNSCSQLALLALWEADRVGLTVPQTLMKRAENTWIKRQKKDGGWGFAGFDKPSQKKKIDSTLSMTSAGLASLYLLQDAMSKRSGPYLRQRPIDLAWGYISQNISPAFIYDGYLAFSIQRVGMASGLKEMGGLDWYAAGANIICAPTPGGRNFNTYRYQDKNNKRVGGRFPYGPTARAAFELLFLSRGRIPLVFNKLKYGKDEDWNYHPRDAARFADYMRRNFERRSRWQIVNIDDKIDWLLDAPLLMISGSKPPEFTDEQKAKLREYALRGGTLMFVPTRNSEAFIEAAKTLLAELFKDQKSVYEKGYMVEKLTAKHPIYRIKRKFKDEEVEKMPIWGLSDGTRLLGVVFGKDIAQAWQQKASRFRDDDYDIAVNLYFYVTGENKLGSRMRPVFSSKKKDTRVTLPAARLKHGGNWYAQPYALDYLAKKLAAENRVKLEVADGVEINPSAIKGKKLLWLTGTGSFTLTDEQLKTLRDYLDQGGLLFVNAAGGNLKFQNAAEDMLEKLFEGSKLRSYDAGPQSPLMTGKTGNYRGPIIKSTDRTEPYRKAVKSAGSPLGVYMNGDYAAAVYSPYGIHDTLDGHTAYEAKSYMPSSALDLAANVALLSLMDRKKPAESMWPPPPPPPPAASQPASAPAGGTDAAADKKPAQPAEKAGDKSAPDAKTPAKDIPKPTQLPA